MLKITDHRLQFYNAYNKDEKVSNMAGIDKIWHRDRKWINVVGKMALINLLIWISILTSFK